MKKWIAGLLITCLAASLTACKERAEQAADSETTDVKTGQEDEGLSAPDEKSKPSECRFTKCKNG